MYNILIYLFKYSLQQHVNIIYELLYNKFRRIPLNIKYILLIIKI